MSMRYSRPVKWLRQMGDSPLSLAYGSDDLPVEYGYDMACASPGGSGKRFACHCLKP